MKAGSAAVLGLAMMAAGCSEGTQDAAGQAAERAAADTEANLEVVGEELEKGAIVAADGISKGAAGVRDELTEERREDAAANDPTSRATSTPPTQPAEQR